MIEQDCVLHFEGKEFSAGGAWLLDGRGVVYADPKNKRVTDWHGNHIARASFGPIYKGPFCKMQAVSFFHDGIFYYGRYCPDWANAVRVRRGIG